MGKRVQFSFYDGMWHRELTKEDDKMDIKVGDTVVAKRDGCEYKKGETYTVINRNKRYPCYVDLRSTVYDRKIFDCNIVNFEKLPPHEGKILIMVDEHDNNKIIARDLITGKTAEAKCNPKDEWNFNTGAKLALERLTEPEKPKGWTGKVVCVCDDAGADNGFHNLDFVVGKVYAVKDGYIISEQHREYTGIMLITSPEQLSWIDHSSTSACPYRCKFIEYKGGAEE